MKRCIAGLAFALMLIRMLTAAAYAQEYQTVSQLRESVPARWTTTIETKWRDVAIDAEIVTPDVEAIPVVKVGYDLHPSPLTPEESGWVEVNDSYETGSLILYMTDDTGKPPYQFSLETGSRFTFRPLIFRGGLPVSSVIYKIRLPVS